MDEGFIKHFLDYFKTANIIIIDNANRTNNLDKLMKFEGGYNINKTLPFILILFSGNNHYELLRCSDKSKLLYGELSGNIKILVDTYITTNGSISSTSGANISSAFRNNDSSSTSFGFDFLGKASSTSGTNGFRDSYIKEGKEDPDTQRALHFLLGPKTKTSTNMIIDGEALGLKSNKKTNKRRQRIIKTYKKKCRNITQNNRKKCNALKRKIKSFKPFKYKKINHKKTRKSTFKKSRAK